MRITLETLAAHIERSHNVSELRIDTETATVLTLIESEEWSFVLTTQLTHHPQEGQETERSGCVTQGIFIHPTTSKVCTLEKLSSQAMAELFVYCNTQLTWCIFTNQTPGAEPFPRLLRHDLFTSEESEIQTIDDQLTMVFDECILIYPVIYEVLDLSSAAASQYMQLLSAETVGSKM